MSRASSIAISAGLIGAGALAWALAARPLSQNADLAAPLNPFGIKRSPYGEVFAMAMQGPIDTEFSIGMFGIAPGQHQQGAKVSPENTIASTASKSHREPVSVNGILRKTLNTMEQGATTRTNPKSPGQALKRHLRRQAEDKLRFTYELDPSHYANYNALHFFLTEPGIGTRPELTPSAAKLAEQTIDYCLKQEHDPRPALTAAAACTNILHLMFADRSSAQPKFNTEQMRHCINQLDVCIARYESISHQWNQQHRWQLLSSQRVTECQDRYTFICRIRDAADETIKNFEKKSHSQQVFNSLSSPHN